MKDKQMDGMIRFAKILILLGILFFNISCEKESIKEYTYYRLFEEISYLSLHQKHECKEQKYKVFNVKYNSVSFIVFRIDNQNVPLKWICFPYLYDRYCNMIKFSEEEKTTNNFKFWKFKKNKKYISYLNNAYDIIEKFNLKGIKWVDNPKQYILIDSTEKEYIIKK